MLNIYSFESSKSQAHVCLGAETHISVRVIYVCKARFDGSDRLVRIQPHYIRSDKGVDRYDCKSVYSDTSWSRPRVLCFQGSVWMIRFVSSV